MIAPQDRFWIIDEAVTGDLHTTNVIDWDQRRWYTVNGSTNFLPPEGEKEIEIVKRYINHLSRGVYSITVDDKGCLVSVSSNPEDDPTLIAHCPRYSSATSLQDCSTISLSRLTELDRLGPAVDLMSYADETGIAKRVVFKYCMIHQRRRYIWDELHMTKSLPVHPNIVPFDRVVVDDAESRIVGFTTIYVPGGSLDENRTRTFQLAWLQQLTALVDYLNLELGIVHQDIAPRNLLVDSKTNKLQLFDFDRAGRVGQSTCFPERNDVTGVIFTLYEIITWDEHFREVPFEEQNPESVQSLEEWPVRCNLDSDPALFRNHLNEWVQRRSDLDNIMIAPQVSETPPLPPPSPRIKGYDEKGEPIYGEGRVVSRRCDDVRLKRNVIFWERPAQQPVKDSGKATNGVADSVENDSL